MGSLLEKSLNFNRKIKINFEGGDLTSDSGLLLYKEFDEKIGFKTFMLKITQQMLELIGMKILPLKEYIRELQVTPPMIIPMN